MDGLDESLEKKMTDPLLRCKASVLLMVRP